MSNRETGKRMAKLRNSKGLKASWVAVQMGIPAPMLCYLEKGKRKWTPWLEHGFLKAIGES